MRTYRLHDASWTRIVTQRVRRPRGLVGRMQSRQRPRGFVPSDASLVLLDCRHGVDPRSGNPIDRRELVGRCVVALSVGGIDGVIATPGMIEELTLLNLLEHRIAACSLEILEPPLRDAIDPSKFDAVVVSNHGGAHGAAFSADLTGFAANDTPTIIQIRPDRTPDQTDLDVPWSTWVSQIRDATVAASTGPGVWLSVPAMAGLNRVADATGFPVLVRDTEIPIQADSWAQFFTSGLPLTVRGMILGVSALFPLEGSVADATRAITTAVRP